MKNRCDVNTNNVYVCEGRIQNISREWRGNELKFAFRVDTVKKNLNDYLNLYIVRKKIIEKKRQK